MEGNGMTAEDEEEKDDEDDVGNVLLELEELL